MKILQYHELPIQNLTGFLSQWDHFVLFDTSLCDSENNKSLVCFDLIERISVENPEEVESAIRKAEKIVKYSGFAVIVLPYEAGFAFEPASGNLKKLPFPCNILFFKHNVIFDHTSGKFSEPILKNEKYHLSTDWTMKQLWYDTQYYEYRTNISRIKNYIRKGDTYQVNYTIRCRFKFSGSVYGMYLDLRERQNVPYSALIKLDNLFILSFSPELFFERIGIGLR